jgi:predicted hydrocarbon binding protein
MNDKKVQKCLSLLERTEYYDDEGEWQIAGSDWLLLSGSTLRSWAANAEQFLGADAKSIMYMTGKQAGERFAERLMEQGLRGEELMYALETFFSNEGWGKVKARLNLKEQTASVRIHNSVTTRQIESDKPVCHFISGYIAGASSVIFGKKTECVEAKCKAEGDAFCEFNANCS